MRIIVVLILAVLCIGILDWTKPETKAELKPLPVTRVVGIEVTKQDLSPNLLLTGKIQPARRAELRFEISGQVIHRHIEPGQIVQQDDVLLSIIDGDYQDRYQEALAELELEKTSVQRDRQQLELLKKEITVQQRELDRWELLGQKSLASKSNYDTALKLILKLRSDESRLRNSVNSSSSKLALRESKVSMAKRNLQRTELRAPFTATVNSVAYEMGDYARAGEVAVELVQLDEMDLYLEVTGSVMSTLTVGQQIQMQIDRQQHTGKIISIQPDPKSDTMTHAIHIRLNANGLYPGQLAQAYLPDDILEQVTVVPLSAILYDQGETFVYKIDDNGSLQRKQVTLLARDNGLQAISGIDSGILVVARDVAALNEGQEVVLEQ